MKELEPLINAVLKKCPACEADLRKIDDLLGDFFRNHSPKLLFCQQVKEHGVCLLVIAVGKMIIRFDLGRGIGTEVGLLLENSYDVHQHLYSPLTVLNFIEDRPARYFGSGYVDPRFASKEAWFKSFNKLEEFFSSGEFESNRSHFEKWLSEYKKEFVKQVNPFDASRK